MQHPMVGPTETDQEIEHQPSLTVLQFSFECCFVVHALVTRGVFPSQDPGRLGDHMVQASQDRVVFV